jgi:hypothetical protein
MSHILHLVKDPEAAIRAFSSTRPFAEAWCGEVERQDHMTLNPFLVGCPACASIANEKLQAGETLPGMPILPTAQRSQGPDPGSSPASPAVSEEASAALGFVQMLLEMHPVDPDGLRLQLSRAEDPQGDLVAASGFAGDVRDMLLTEDLALVSQLMAMASSQNQEAIAAHLGTVMLRSFRRGVEVALTFTRSIPIPTPDLSDDGPAQDVEGEDPPVHGFEEVDPSGDELVDDGEELDPAEESADEEEASFDTTSPDPIEIEEREKVEAT